jgi:arylsulfatase
VIDIVPTILEVTGIPAPDLVDGVGQKPIEGVSMAYTFDNADAASTHKTQYFEMLGVQGLYNDGWMLSAVPKRPPWELLGTAILDPASAFKFELYEVRKDWTQYEDVAAQNPEKLREMTDLMFAEFAKYQVLPLDASVATRMVMPRPSLSAGRKVFAYSGQPNTGIPRGTAPSLLNTSYTIIADIDVPEGGAEGMIVTDGGRFGGYGLYLLKGKPVFTWNLLDLKRIKWQSDEALAPGKHTLVFDFKYDALGFATLAFNSISGIGRGGTGPFRSTARSSPRRPWSARCR